MKGSIEKMWSVSRVDQALDMIQVRTWCQYREVVLRVLRGPEEDVVL